MDVYVGQYVHCFDSRGGRECQSRVQRQPSCWCHENRQTWLWEISPAFFSWSLIWVTLRIKYLITHVIMWLPIINLAVRCNRALLTFRNFSHNPPVESESRTIIYLSTLSFVSCWKLWGILFSRISKGHGLTGSSGIKNRILLLCLSVLFDTSQNLGFCIVKIVWSASYWQECPSQEIVENSNFSSESENT